MKRRPPTYAEAERIAVIVAEVEVRYTPESFDWKTHKAEAYALLRAMGEKAPDKSCFSCWVNALNKLRKAIGQPPFDHGASAERTAFRLDVCTTCPAFHTSTESCGRLILDALSPQAVMIDGEPVNPCGCRMTDFGLWKGKASLKHATCPANKWT